MRLFISNGLQRYCFFLDCANYFACWGTFFLLVSTFFSVCQYVFLCLSVRFSLLVSTFFCLSALLFRSSVRFYWV